MSVAGSPEYQREYQRLRYRGLPTKGLAARMRGGIHEQIVTARTHRRIEQWIARGRVTSEIMVGLDVSYAEVQTVRQNIDRHGVDLEATG